LGTPVCRLLLLADAKNEDIGALALYQQDWVLAVDILSTLVTEFVCVRTVEGDDDEVS
jgi:hypothetical protein